MVYSCAYWEPPDGTLEDAQRDKLDLVCRKLGARGRAAAARRRLRLGLDGHARRPRVRRPSVVGVTLSQEQAAYARKRVAEEGLTDRVEIRVQDYRDVTDGPYDAISSIGMAEHVGAERYLEYAERPVRPAAGPAGGC